jgi:hypothetical protein
MLSDACRRAGVAHTRRARTHVDMSRPARSWQRCKRVIALTAMLVLPIQASAQTLFPAAGGPDFTRYTAPAMCVAAAERVRDSTWSWGAAERDTFPLDPQEALPGPVAETARRCAVRFRGDDATPSELPALMQLALFAGDDSLAQRMLDRHIEMLRQRPVVERAAVLYTALESDLAAHPIRLAAAERTTAALDQLGPSAWHERLFAHDALYQYSLSVLDTVGVRREGTVWIADLRASHSPLAGSELAQVHIAERASSARFVAALRDSSAVAINAIRRNSIATMFGTQLADRLLGAVGHPAPPLNNDYSFETPKPSHDASARRLDLLVYVDHRCRLADCAPDFAVLRRLQQRYQIPTTLVARTYGFFRERPPVGPTEEAAAMRDYFLGFLALPASLRATTTPFTRLPDPDRRRIDGEITAYAVYGFPQSSGPGSQGNIAVLIDAEGTVVFQQQLGPQTERMWGAFIAAAHRDVAPAP